jgi:hypothetical protein
MCERRDSNGNRHVHDPPIVWRHRLELGPIAGQEPKILSTGNDLDFVRAQGTGAMGKWFGLGEAWVANRDHCPAVGALANDSRPRPVRSASQQIVDDAGRTFHQRIYTGYLRAERDLVQLCPALVGGYESGVQAHAYAAQLGVRTSPHGQMRIDTFDEIRQWVVETAGMGAPPGFVADHDRIGLRPMKQSQADRRIAGMK